MKHGEKVIFTHRLVRTSEQRQAKSASGRTYTRTWKCWRETRADGEGLFLGTRTLKNGIREWEDEVGYIFTPKEYVQAALISLDLKTNPIYVPLKSCEPANEN